MRFRKERRSFSIWEHFICRRKSRGIIKGEETDRAAVFAAGLCVNNWSTERKSLDVNKSLLTWKGEKKVEERKFYLSPCFKKELKTGTS